MRNDPRRPIGPGRIALAALFTCGLILSAGGEVPAGDANKSRTWSDATGRFKIEGKLVGVKETKVTIEKGDGKRIVIDITKLSKSDQKLIEKMLPSLEDDNPFKEADAADAKSPGKKGTPVGKAPPAGKVGAEAKVISVDWSGAKPIPLVPSQGGWKVEASPAPADVKLTSRPFFVPPRLDFFEGPKGFPTNARSGRGVIGYTLNKPGGGTDMTRLVLCDLVKGASLGTATDAGQCTPLDLHDNGTQILMRRDESGFGNRGQNRLEIWNFDGKSIEKGQQWQPYANEGDGRGFGNDRDVKWAAFLDGGKLATCSGNGKLAIWEADGARPLYYLLIGGNSVPALTPDRKYITFTTGKEIGVLDVAKEEVVALQAIANVNFPVLAVSPSAKYLACAAFDRLFVWNLADGTLYREMPYLGLHVHGQILWADDDHVLLGGKYLMDLVNQIPLWEYNTQHGTIIGQSGQTLFYVVASLQHQQPGIVLPAQLPHPGVEQMLKQSMADPNFFVLKPGTTVRLDVSGIQDMQQKQQVAQTLTARLTAKGFKVGAGGTIELAASTELGKAREVSYHGFGGPPRTYSVQEHLTRVKFVSQGKTAWESVGNNIPGILQRKDGESTEQALRRHERPNFAFFQHVELPQLLIRPTGRPTLGTSQVTNTGIK